MVNAGNLLDAGHTCKGLNSGSSLNIGEESLPSLSPPDIMSIIGDKTSVTGDKNAENEPENIKLQQLH